MTAQELIDATIGEGGMETHDALAMMFDDGDEYAMTVREVKDMLMSLIESDTDKRILTLSEKQASVLLVFFFSGHNTFVNILRSGKDAV